MKTRFLFFLSALAGMLAMVSCGPSLYTFNVERRADSEANSLIGKSLSLVYVCPGNPVDSLVTCEIAQGFAAALEGEYYGGRQVMPVYALAQGDASVADYASKDTLVGLVTRTGADVVFLLHGVSCGGLERKPSAFVEQPFKASFSVYDSMDSRDTVINNVLDDAFLWRCSDTQMPDKAVMEAVWAEIPNAAFGLGHSAAEPYMAEWENERYVIVLYSSDSGWMQAASMGVDMMQWKDALDYWMKAAESKDLLKRAHASYNCALACHLLGDNALALQWLDLADSLYGERQGYSMSLRSRIEASSSGGK